MKKFTLSFVLLLFIFSNVSYAHQPVREVKNSTVEKGALLDLENATRIKDPTAQSLAIYGRIDSPHQIDLYTFTSSKSAEIPIEVLVPVRISNEKFRPSFAFIQPISEELNEKNEISINESLKDPPFKITEGYTAEFFNVEGERKIFFEPFSVENLYHGNEKKFLIESGKTYYVAVYEPSGYTGDYSLGVGTVENFKDVSFTDLLGEVFLIKMGLYGVDNIPWLDIAGLFLFIAGFVIGLGAVTVIDFHGLLARKSMYWTEATIRSHKITKPLIWAGLIMATIGAGIYYRVSGLSSTATFHLFIIVILVLNGLYLSFRISPYLIQQEKVGKSKQLLPKKIQRKITISFIISFLGWWTGLFLLVCHVLVAR